MGALSVGERQPGNLFLLAGAGQGAPCGACRELMVQIMPDSYRAIEIMMDYAAGRIVRLDDITPEWRV